MILPFLAFLLASLIGGGFNGVVIRYVSTDFGPLTGSFLRFLGATIFLLPFWLQKKEIIPTKDLIKIIPFSINVAIFSIAIVHTSVIMYNVLYGLVPVLVAFLGFYILKEKLAKEHIAGLFFSLIGISILLYGSIKTNDIRTFGEPLGNILILIGGLTWSFWIVGARTLSKKYSLLTILFHMFLVSAVLVAFTVPFEWSVRPFNLSDITFEGIGSLAGVIFVSSILLYFLHQWIITNTSAFFASLIQYGAIAFGPIAGAIFFQERLTAQLVVGAMLVIAGAFLATTYTQLKKQA